MHKNRLTYFKEKLLVGIILSFFLLAFIWYHYISFQEDMYYEELENNMYIETLYSKIWKYHIGKQTSWPVFWGDTWEINTLCNVNNRKCLNFELRWIIEKGIYIYIYMYSEYYINIDYNKLHRWKDYPTIYSIFWEKYINTPETFEDLKQFWILTQDTMNFYSLNELKNLPKEQQEILLDLQRNPRFIFEK